MTNPDCIIIGAGPVGLLASILAAGKGMRVLLLERFRIRPRQSRAIGITPPSLEILATAGLSDRFAAAGIRVRAAEGHSPGNRLGRVSFDNLASAFPFILSLPQDRTEAFLESEVLRTKRIKFQKGSSLTGLSISAGSVEIRTDSSNHPLPAAFALACDGGRSTTRGLLGIPFRGKSYPHTFLMGDYRDPTDWGDEARLYFTSEGSVESFPLPGRRRRFVVRTPSFVKDPAEGARFLREALKRRCGIGPSSLGNPFWTSPFGTQRYLAARFHSGRVLLCGDAGHLMSPIGGQNMNTGFADAEFAVTAVRRLLDGADPLSVLTLYNGIRRRAADAAAGRAELMMRFGTSGGPIWSGLRAPLLAAGLASPLRRYFEGMFAMTTIPNRNLSACGSGVGRILAP